MIGILARESEKEIVKEFFELFKTPWKFYEGDNFYDVVLTTAEDFEESHIKKMNTKLLLIFTSEELPLDENNVQTKMQNRKTTLRYDKIDFPVYGKMLTFKSTDRVFLKVKDNNEAAGIEIVMNGKDIRIMRIGFDLFHEISFLLMSGQPVEYSNVPTLEFHISVLRSLIVNSGIPLVEIPPVPAGSSFIVCLTHDVDFISIRNHKFDRSFFGFLFRALFPFSTRGLNLGMSISKYIKNLRALLSLPGVYLGLLRDVWYDIDRYMDLENGMGSTFFFIPFKDQPGDPQKNRPPRYRASRYDINDYEEVIRNLIRNGYEIGLHGIDAWHDSKKGRRELQAISKITDDMEVGVRMHWLYFSYDSPKTLEEIGFLYDSTLGYNEAIGYKSGTTQVFYLWNTSNMPELPLHVMDTALFNRMSITEPQALRMCGKLIDNVREHGGVFTVNWHTRSLSPERNWDGFYIELLTRLKAERPWFATGKQAVRWFRKRRATWFEGVDLMGDRICLRLNSNGHDSLTPPLMLRIHYPLARRAKAENSFVNQSFIDIPWQGEPQIEHVLDLVSA